MKVKHEGVVGFEDGNETAIDGFAPRPKKNNKNKGGGFQTMELSGVVLKGLQKRGYKLPTPIQRKSIPIILEGRDLVAMARTGSGKTACFLIPMFEKLLKPTVTKATGIRALVMSPTRELALQTLRFIREIGRFTRLNAITVLGGDSMDTQFNAMHNNPDIVVATPGRFLHLCVEMDLKLTTVEYVVFDEADRLFEMGFGEQLSEILNRLSDCRQTVLFSATLPKQLVHFAKAGLSDPVLIRLDVENKLPDALELAFLSARSEDKPAALLCLLQGLPSNAQTLVFLATKHHVEYIHMLLDLAGISNTFIYSDLDASARKINAAKFQTGNVSVLLVTDVAARGVDIPQLDYVINYHFPAKAKLFVHRVGRCARAGRTGTAFSLVSAEEAPFVLDLHLFLGRPLNLLPPTPQQHAPQKQDCAFGKIPEAAIEAEQSRVIAWHETVVEMESMQKVCSNGYKKYLRSRPGASSESVKRMRDLDLAAIGVHQFFHRVDTEADSARELLEKMKNYKPKGTIFELNVSAKSKGYAVMKTTKKAHERMLQNFKQKKALNEDSPAVRRDQPECQLPVSDEKDISNTFGTIIMGKRKKPQEHEEEPKKKKKKKTVDKEHYIPHSAPDRYTEEGLSVNNFTTEANKVTFDMTDDTTEGLNLSRQLKKWDKKKMKMVGVESAKAGKIRTESGVWISKSFKSNRYAEWKEKSKMAETIDSDPDEDGDMAPPPTRFNNKKKDFPNTHWGRHNLKMAAKDKMRAGLKNPEQILKARTELRKKQLRSMPKHKKQAWGSDKGGGGGFRGGRGGSRGRGAGRGGESRGGGGGSRGRGGESRGGGGGSRGRGGGSRGGRGGRGGKR